MIVVPAGDFMPMSILEVDVFKRLIVATFICVGWTKMSAAEEITFEVVGTFDRVSSVLTDAFMEGDRYTLTVRYDDQVQGSQLEGEFFSQTTYPAILAANLTTSGGVETSLTTGANSSVTINQQGADVVFFSFNDFDLNLESQVPNFELGTYQMALDFVMPKGSLASQALTDLKSVLESDLLLSAPDVGVNGFETLRFDDGGSLFISSSVDAVDDVRIVPEPASGHLVFVACCVVVVTIRRQSHR